MKKWITLACMALLVVQAFAQTPEEESTRVKTGQQAPAFTVAMLDGSTVSTADLRGKVVLVNFWATWCGPCRQEFARMQKDVVDRFAGRPFVLLAISRGEQADVVRQFMTSAGHKFPVGLDPDAKIYNLFAEKYIPRNFVIDKQGKIAFLSVGYSEGEFKGMLTRIDNLLK